MIDPDVFQVGITFPSASLFDEVYWRTGHRKISGSSNAYRMRVVACNIFPNLRDACFQDPTVTSSIYWFAIPMQKQVISTVGSKFEVIFYDLNRANDGVGSCREGEGGVRIDAMFIRFEMYSYFCIGCLILDGKLVYTYSMLIRV